MKTKYLIGFGLWAALVACVPCASAVPTLRVNSGANTVDIGDQSASDINSTAGAVSWMGGLDNWSVIVSTGVTKPAFGSATAPYIDLNSLQISSEGGGTVRILFSETGFTSATAQTFLGQVGGTSTGSSIQVWLFADAGNNLFGRTTTILSPGGVMHGPIFDGTGTGLGVSGTFSLTMKIQVTHRAAGTTSLNFQASAPPASVPDGGATVLLFGAGLLGIGLIGRSIRWVC